MRQHCGALQRGHELLLEQLQALPGHISRIDGDSRDVAPWVSETWDESDLNRGIHAGKDDWD